MLHIVAIRKLCPSPLTYFWFSASRLLSPLLTLSSHISSLGTTSCTGATFPGRVGVLHEFFLVNLALDLLNAVLKSLQTPSKTKMLQSRAKQPIDTIKWDILDVCDLVINVAKPGQNMSEWNNDVLNLMHDDHCDYNYAAKDDNNTTNSDLHAVLPRDFFAARSCCRLRLGQSSMLPHQFHIFLSSIVVYCCGFRKEW